MPGEEGRLRFDAGIWTSRRVRADITVAGIGRDSLRDAGLFGFGAAPGLLVLCSTLSPLRVKICWDIPAREDQRFGRARRRRVPFNCSKVDGHEPDQEGKQNPKVTPHVFVAVLVHGGNVSITVNRGPARDGARDGTHPGVADRGRDGRHDLGTDELAAVELIGDEDLEGVEDGVEPADPAKPGVHLRNGDAVIGMLVVLSGQVCLLAPESSLKSTKAGKTKKSETYMYPVYMTSASTNTPANAIACETVLVIAASVRNTALITKVAMNETRKKIKN